MRVDVLRGGSRGWGWGEEEDEEERKETSKSCCISSGIIVVCCYCLSVSVAAGVCACVGDCLWFETAAGKGGLQFLFSRGGVEKKKKGGVSLPALAQWADSSVCDITTSILTYLKWP